jgi:FkbM family methyltransferase
MKVILKAIFNKLGYTVIKIKPEKIFDNQKIIMPTDNKFWDKPLKFYQTPIGNYYLPADATADLIATKMREGEIFEPAIVDVARQYIKKGSLVLDVGANFGQMSLIFSQLVGEQGQVLSLEADDYIFYVLEQNIKANNCQNIQPIFGAVYNKTGKVMICYGSFGLDPNTTEGRQVQTIAIDDLKIDREVSFMKVDVQGSDLFAMQGAIETIKKYRMPIIFEFEQQFQKQFNTCFQDYLDFIASINYKVEEVVDNINYLIVPKV